MHREKHSVHHMRKRQWGAEKRTTPLSKLHDRPSTSKIAFSRLAIVVTILFWIVYITSTIVRQLMDGPQSYHFTMEAFGYLLVMSVLTFSALMYLIARQGAFQRFSKHVRVPRFILDKHFSQNHSAITVLVPSYSEEPQVIRKTLLSAALQEYPEIRVVLLLDDNPYPTQQTAITRLTATRALISDIAALLEEPHTRFHKALSDFEHDFAHKKSISTAAVAELARHYAWAASWLETLADKEEVEDHVDIFFVEQVLRELANELHLVGEALTTSVKEGAQLSKDRIQQLYKRLVWTFGANLEVFERKKYISLSHEANKAMNLNSYIGLMGSSYRKENTPDGTILVPVAKKSLGDITIPDTEFILTLDADSILLRDYCLRLVHFLQQPDNERVAVTQTPYSSFRGAYSRIERLSGATTDIQHILHQGMSHYGATFWVGANAVIRKKALEEISERVGGWF